MGKDLSVRLGVKLVPTLDELLAKSLVIFDDTVVHKIETT